MIKSPSKMKHSSVLKSFVDEPLDLQEGDYEFPKLTDSYQQFELQKSFFQVKEVEDELLSISSEDDSQLEHSVVLQDKLPSKKIFSKTFTDLSLPSGNFLTRTFQFLDNFFN